MHVLPGALWRQAGTGPWGNGYLLWLAPTLKKKKQDVGGRHSKRRVFSLRRVVCGGGLASSSVDFKEAGTCTLHHGFRCSNVMYVNTP